MAETSEEMASVAGKIMAMAKEGPVKHFEAELRKEFSLGEDDNIVFHKITAIFQPYFDDAESLAGSVMSQREVP